MLVFGNSHSAVERLGLLAKDWGLKGLEVYRGGLTQARRKILEGMFKRGKIDVLVTTSALELGMDIPSVDIVMLSGFPGSITRVKQRVGRAGRKGQEALAFFIARDNPLDQYYVDHIEEYIHGVPDFAAYLEKCGGRARLAELRRLEQEEN